MKKILWVAIREFCATALTKGFIFGVVMTPLLMFIAIGAVAYMKSLGSPRVVGEVAVIDRSGAVGGYITGRFTPDAVAHEAQEATDEMKKQVADRAAAAGLDEKKTQQVMGSVGPAMTEAKGAPAQLSVLVLPPDADADKEKAPVAEARIKTTRGEDDHSEPSRVALVVIPPETVRGDTKGAFPPYQAYFAEKLDFEIRQNIEQRIGDAVVDARVAGDTRLGGTGLGAKELRTLIARPGVDSKDMGKGGEKKSMGELKMLVPMVFMILMMVSVFTSGQYLLTSTVEEKGNRVMEVLLSALSPMQLMTGKIIGQMCVGVAILVLYSGLGVVSLVAFVRATNLVEGPQLLYLFIYFAIAYLLVASMMVAIGAAVNEMREAQALMGPVMVVLMIPWLTWFVIQRAPNSMVATVLSFIPGPNPFVMVLRLSGSEPIPAWQIPASMAVGVVSVLFMFWAAGKVFRVGALMHGKPPNLRTLARWVRMA